jgi:hypothetical protein
VILEGISRASVPFVKKSKDYAGIFTVGVIQEPNFRGHHSSSDVE